MGTISASTVINKAQMILQDASGVRWPASGELLGWLNDGQREVVIYKPNASVKNAAVRLVEGTKQTLPADGVQLIDIARNLGSNGSTPGRAIRIAMREMLDAANPDWHTSPASATVKHFMYSALDPKSFYVYPPQPASPSYVELIFAAAPADATINGAITIDDIYANVLVDYILFRAFSKDGEFAADSGRAAYHQQAYLATLTGKVRGEVAANPNATAPANPSPQHPSI